jgi:hypothetical protein
MRRDIRGRGGGTDLDDDHDATGVPAVVRVIPRSPPDVAT